MNQGRENESVIQAGLNSEVEHHGRVFHVQTESIQRSAPVVETLIYSGGEVLVRMTASLAGLAERAELSSDDIRHALQLQHWNLVRKVQHGMLGDDTPTPPAETTIEPKCEPSFQHADAAARAEPSVRELLDELKRKIDKAQRQSAAQRPSPAAEARAATSKGWWKRYTGRLSLVVRW